MLALASTAISLMLYWPGIDPSQDATNRAPQQLKADQAMGGILAKDCPAALESPQVILRPALSFNEKVLRDAGNINQLTRDQLDDLRFDLEIAALRDLGLILELNYRAAGDRRTLLPGLVNKWGGLKGEALRAEYYRALVAALEFAAEQSRNKNPDARGFADRLLLSSGNVRTLPRTEVDSLWEDYKNAELRDRGLALELAQRARQPASALKAELTQKWTELRGEALKDAYYETAWKGLTEKRRIALGKKAQQLTVAERLLLDANSLESMSRRQLDAFFELYLIASRCEP